jgi:hypothetical protein
MQLILKVLERNKWQHDKTTDVSMPCDLRQFDEEIVFRKETDWKFSPPTMYRYTSKTSVTLPRSLELTRDNAYEQTSDSGWRY